MRPPPQRGQTLTHTAIQEPAPRRAPPAQTGNGSPAGKLGATLLVSLDDAKAEDVVTIDLAGKTSIADLMIIASGRSSTHVASIADRIMKALKEEGFGTPRVEGLTHGDWVLIDAGDAIVHIFRPEVRQFYNLEKMWGGARPDEQRHA